MEMGFRKMIVWLLILMLVLPSGAFANSNAVQPEIITTQVQPETTLFDQELLDALDQDEAQYDVLIYLSDQVDNAEYETMSQNAHTYQEREAIARDYIAALEDKAAITQRPFLNLLSQAKEQGLVAEYEGLFIINVIRVLGDRSVIEQLSRLPGIRKIELNQTFELQVMDEIDEADYQVDDGNWNLEMIKANKVWQDFNVDGTGTVVGIIDSGVQFVHPALKNKWRGYDPATNDFVEPEKSWFEAIPSYWVEQSPYPVDNSTSHGTHAAGIIMGSEADGKNTIGVAPGAKFIAARAFNNFNNTDTFVMLRAGQWMLKPGGDVNAKPDVVSNSWTNPKRINDWYKDIINAWRMANIVPVFASGNVPLPDASNRDVPENEIGNPANYPESFAVGSVNRDGQLSSFSNVGPSRYDNTIIKPDVVAPGGAIRSAIGTGNYGMKSGTSMAAPHVAGVVALLRQANPDLSVEQIETILKDTATAATDAKYPTSPNMGYGHGVVDAYNAVASVLGEGNAVITGRVMREGSDTANPQLSVTVPQGMYAHQDFVITARATDNLGVESFTVEITTSEDTYTYDMEMVSGTLDNANYRFHVPAKIVVAGPMTLKFTAVDANGNQTEETVVRDITPAVNPQVGYFNDFETGDDGFRFRGSFKRAKMLSYITHDYSPPPSGEYLIGNSPDQWGGYDRKVPGYAELPPIHMANLDMDTPFVSYVMRNYAARLSFVNFQVSTDLGKTWQTLKQYTQTVNFWKYEFFDLSEYKGTDTLFLRFETYITGDSNDRGLLVDDVTIGVKNDNSPLPAKELEAVNSFNGVKLRWSKSDSFNVKAYDIYRSSGAEAAVKVGSTPVMSETDFPNILEYVDTTAVQGETYQYYVLAVDYFGNESIPSNTAEITVDLLTSIYFSDFNDDDGGLEPVAIGENGLVDWTWMHHPEQRSNPTKHWATSKGSGVSQAAEYALVTPSLTIPAEGASLVFDSRSDIWWSSDPTQRAGNGEVQISRDNGETWETLVEASAMFSFNYKGIWLRITADIGEEYAGEVKIRFWLETSFSANTNPSYPEYGWYIDNLLIVEGQHSSILQLDTVEQPSHDLPYGEIPPQALVAEVESVEPEAIPVGYIPLPGATVRVIETAQATRSDGVGRYRLEQGLTEVEQVVTLEASAYGYHTKTEQVTLKAGQSLTQDFVLEELGRGTIEGTVTDSAGQPIAGVNVGLSGISSKPLIQTDAEGRYRFEDLYEGTYQLRFVHADYKIERREVELASDQVAVVDIQLIDSTSFDEWIIYDNGKSSDAIAFTNAGNGFAVRFQAEGDGVLSAGNLYFVDDWPDMYGREIEIGVLQVNLETGDVAELIPFKRYLINRGEWNEIDFSGYGLEVKKGDIFFIATRQMYTGGNNPALGIDSLSPYGEHSFAYTGTFQLMRDVSETALGSLMIRAKLAYDSKDIHPPKFTNIDPIHYINQSTLSLEGSVSEDGQVEIYLNDQKVQTVDTHRRLFQADIEVRQPINQLKAILVGNAERRSQPSQVHTIIYDTTAPELTVDSHRDGQTVAQAETIISGLAKDQYLDYVLVNGYRASLEGERYSYPVELTTGENKIEIDAFDKAGNRTRIELSLHYQSESGDLVISRLTPEEDIQLAAGDEYLITLEGTPGAQAGAKVILPLTLQAESPMIELTETTPGVYTGTWQSPANTAGIFQVVGRLSQGNDAVEATSQGKIELYDNQPTFERLAGKNRFETAVLFSQANYDQADTVVLANAYTNVDALAATPLAVVHNAPILLTGADRLPAETLAEINRLGASRIILIGGELAINSQLEADLAKDFTVDRFSGANRYATSRLIAEEVLKHSASDSLLLVGGQKMIDATSVGAASKVADAKGVSPIVFVDSGYTGLPAGTNQAILLGGKAAISQAVEQAVAEQGYVTYRIAGATRYDTNVLIAREYFPEATKAIVANGSNPIDAIAAGPYAANQAMPILLVDETVSPALENYLSEQPIRYLVFAGGTAAISDKVAVTLINLIW